MVTTLRIAGMSCNNCVRHVGDALRGVPGVSAVAVDLPGGAATVTHDDAPLARLIDAVAAAGYASEPTGEQVPLGCEAAPE